MRHIIAPIAAFLISTAAFAADPVADKPIIGPIPPWVHPAELPKDAPKPDQQAVRLLLVDQQQHLLPNGGEIYSETVMRVQTAQGLEALGTITLPWKPDQGTLTVHKLNIIRDGKVIDLLTKGPGFTVLRREQGLEYATLDGVLTAVIQPEGLQVGDVVDLATTTKTIDPALGGNSEAFLSIASELRAAHVRMRVEWSSGLPVRWHAEDGLPLLSEHKAGGLSEVSFALDNVEPLILPRDAPTRFMLPRLLTATTLKSWEQLSTLFAPLYEKAATLKPDSALKAEIATIAQDAADPVHRAEAALALVQDKVRYVFLGMNDGGLVPADADTTWQRRFADCKGKTALLLALLHGLGIEAEPALVSTTLGDGMDQRLPMVAFDHVMVRAKIGGKVYWLDGTRTGDVRLADIKVPDFRFALPLRAAGATLEPLVVPVPDRPLREYSFKVDMTGGITIPFPFHVEELLRDDAAVSMHLTLDQLTPEVRDESLRQVFTSGYPDVAAKTVSAVWDPVARTEKLVMDGAGKHDWKYSYEADHSRLGWNADFERPAGPHRDAPYASSYPFYVVVRETILLPDAKNFLNQSTDVDRTIGGTEMRRHAKLDGTTYTIETSVRTIAREFPAADAPAAQEALRDLYRQQALLGVKYSYQPTQHERDAWLTMTPTTANEYYRRAEMRLAKNDKDGGLADVEKAIALQSDYGQAYLMRGQIYWRNGDYAKALADLQKSAQLMAASSTAHAALAELMTQMGRYDDGLAEINRALAIDADNPRLLAVRAETYRRLNQFDAGTADIKAAISKDPTLVRAYIVEADLMADQGRYEDALAAAKAAAAANPKDMQTHLVLGAVYTKLRRYPEADVEFAKYVSAKPDADLYAQRANLRSPADIQGQRADVAAALKLDRENATARNLEAKLDLKAGKYAAVIDSATALMPKQPHNGPLIAYRGIAYAQTGRAALAAKDFADARTAVGDHSNALNDLCWDKAILGMALDAAMVDCDAALKISPEAGYILDTRGLVLLRLGRFADAVETYDKALRVRPRLTASLYGRGLAKRHLGKAVEGDADIAAARALDPGISKDFDAYGVTG